MDVKSLPEFTGPPRRLVHVGKKSRRDLCSRTNPLPQVEIPTLEYEMDPATASKIFRAGGAALTLFTPD